MGVGHDSIGAYLLALWGLPQNIVESVAFHHDLRTCYDYQGNDSALFVCAANMLAHSNDVESHRPTIENAIDADRIDSFMEKLNKWNEMSEEKAEVTNES